MLDTYLNEVRHRPFKWLEHDCVSFVNGWTERMCGKVFFHEHATHTNLLTALRDLRRNGGYQGLGDRLGSRIAPAFAQRGDVILVYSGLKIGAVSGYTYGVCSGDFIAVPGPSGLEFADITQGIAAWRPSRNSSS